MLSVVTALSVLGLCHGWTRARDERMPGELRVVNEGLSHDDEYWYMTNKHFIYKVNAKPLTITTSNHNAIPQELRDEGYDHIGDIEVDSGILYGGIEGGPTGVLARWNTSTLELINYVKITQQKGVPWVTFNPDNKKLYAQEWNRQDMVNVYDPLTPNFDFVESIPIVNATAYPKEVQGASFYQGDLYLATNVEDAVYKFNIKTGDVEFVLSDNDNYVIDGYYYEMEGLTFWDLSEDGLGVMHMYGNFMNAREKAIHSFQP